PYGEGITFWPVAEMVRSAAGIDETDGAETVLGKLEAVFPEGDDRPVAAARIASLLGTLDESTPLQEIFSAVRRLFSSLALDEPLVVVFDDLHWAEPGLLDLIEYVLTWSSGASILLLCLARQELLEERPIFAVPKPNASSILLDPLPEEASHELITN